MNLNNEYELNNVGKLYENDNGLDLNCHFILQSWMQKSKKLEAVFPLLIWCQRNWLITGWPGSTRHNNQSKESAHHRLTRQHEPQPMKIIGTSQVDRAARATTNQSIGSSEVNQAARASTNQNRLRHRGQEELLEVENHL